jgi:hypothetical protein
MTLAMTPRIRHCWPIIIVTVIRHAMALCFVFVLFSRCNIFSRLGAFMFLPHQARLHYTLVLRGIV